MTQQKHAHAVMALILKSTMTEKHENSVKMINPQLFDNDRNLHARSPSGLLAGSPLILAASSSAKDVGPAS